MEQGGLRGGPGGGAKISVEGGLAETSGFSPSRHPGSVDVDTGREGLPDTAGILRATDWRQLDSRRKKGGVERGGQLWEER